MKSLPKLLEAVQSVIDSADNTGCSEDLTVIESEALDTLRQAAQTVNEEREHETP